MAKNKSMPYQIMPGEQKSHTRNQIKKKKKSAFFFVCAVQHTGFQKRISNGILPVAL